MKKLLKESKLDFGKVDITAEKKQLEQATGVGILANNSCILVLLPSEESPLSKLHEVADRLLECVEFKEDMQMLLGGSFTLNKKESKVLDFIRSSSCVSISESVQGKTLPQKRVSKVVALINGAGKNQMEIAIRVCTTSNTMTCFYPNAKPLSLARLDKTLMDDTKNKAVN